MSNLRILLIKDDESFARIVESALKALKSIRAVTHVTSVAAALHELAHQNCDIALTDLTLPDAVELESVDRLQTFSPELPLIVLTSHESHELTLQTLHAEAQDYIIKDLMNPKTLERIIWHAIERHSIRTENARLIGELETQKKQLNLKNTQLQQLVETAHRFVDNVSHEFRTPLTVVREYASLMSDGALGRITPQQTEFLDVIRYRVDDLNTMVDDMLDSSKLAAGIMGMHRVSTPPTEIVDRPLSGLALKAQVRGVELVLEPEHDLPHVFCDPEKAGRVVTNLVSNAITFCEDGTGRVLVAMRHLTDQRDVEISVADNGPGIDSDGLNRMFGRFQQLGTGTQSSTKGFGLGLNIARELVDQNFGTITVESTVDVGTTFRFTIPVDDWPEIVRRYAVRLSQKDSAASIVVVRALAHDTHGQSCRKDIDAFWRYTEKQADLVRRTGSLEWTLLFASDLNELPQIIEGFLVDHAKVNRNRTKPMPDLTFTTVGCFAVADGNDALLAAVSVDVPDSVEQPHCEDERTVLDHEASAHQEIQSPAFLKSTRERADSADESTSIF
jgi:signal transduction histidine kinase